MEISKSLTILKSISDVSRLRVINSLMLKSQYVEELSKRLNLAESTISFHLKKLEQAEIVFKSKEQYYVVYHLNEEILNLKLKDFLTTDNLDYYVEEERISKYRDGVIKAFYKNGKLKALPVQRKKKIIILHEFMKLFKAGMQYSETEINELITHQYEDYCTVRRLLIEEGFMNRKNAIYTIDIKNINRDKL